MHHPFKIKGFTLIELLVVLAIIATLLSLVLPRYIGQTDRAKDAALKENLAAFRASLDQYYGDTGSFPESLNILIEKRYLRKIPFDPITERADTWVLTIIDEDGHKVISDIKSAATENGLDGTPYNTW